MPVAGGVAEEVLPGLDLSDWGSWAVGERGIYYLTRSPTAIAYTAFADPGRVVRHVVRSGLYLAGLGILAGSLAAALGTRALRSMLFEVSTLAPTAYLAPAATLAVAAVVAAWVPALQAGRLAPTEALRHE